MIEVYLYRIKLYSRYLGSGSPRCTKFQVFGGASGIRRAECMPLTAHGCAIGYHGQLPKVAGSAACRLYPYACIHEDWSSPLAT